MVFLKTRENEKIREILEEQERQSAPSFPKAEKWKYTVSQFMRAENRRINENR